MNVLDNFKITSILHVLSVKNFYLAVPHICKVGERVITTSYSCKDEVCRICLVCRVVMIAIVINWYVHAIHNCLSYQSDVFSVCIFIFNVYAFNLPS